MGITRRNTVRTATGTKVAAHRRRGVGYVYFLTTMMLIAVMGVSALLAARVQLRSAGGTNDSTAARFYAQSAIELGLAEIHLDPNWRTNLGTGIWISGQAIGAGTLSLEASILNDGDGNPDNDSVRLIGTGVHGQAQYKTEVTLAALSDKGGLVIPPGSWRRSEG
jgi:hypothetical protein